MTAFLFCMQRLALTAAMADNFANVLPRLFTTLAVTSSSITAPFHHFPSSRVSSYCPFFMLPPPPVIIRRTKHFILNTARKCHTAPVEPAQARTLSQPQRTEEPTKRMAQLDEGTQHHEKKRRNNFSTPFFLSHFLCVCLLTPSAYFSTSFSSMFLSVILFHVPKFVFLHPLLLL